MSDNRNNLKYGALVSYLYIFINVGVGLIYTPWMLRRIGDSEYGLYSLALSIITFLTIDFGLGWAVSRYIAVYHSQKNIEDEKKFTGIVLKLYLMIDLVIFLILFVLFFFLDKIYGGLSAEELAKFRIIYVIVGFYTVTTFPFQAVPGLFVGKGLLYVSKFADLMQRIITTAIMVATILTGYRIYALVIVNVLIGALTLAFKISYLIKHQYLHIDLKARDFGLVKSIFGFSVWTSISSIMNRIMFNLMPSFLAAFSGSLDVAIFSFASTFEGYVSYFAVAVRDLLLPNVAEIIHRNNQEELLDLMIKAGRIQLKIIGLIVVGFAIIGKEFMTVYIGPQFINVYYLTLAMIVPYLISATQDIAQNAVLVNGYVKERGIMNLFSGTLIIVLAVILIPMIGGLGSGVSIFIGLSVNTVLMNYLFITRLHIDIMTFFRKCHLSSLPSMFAAAALSLLAVRIMPSAVSWTMVGIKIIAITLIYMAVIGLFGMNEFEKELVRKTLRKF